MNTSRGMKALLVLVTVAFGGCSVADQMRDLPGTDQTLLGGGHERAAIRKALGEPLRTWKPNETVDYELHAIRRPLKGSKSEAGGVVFMDVITLGLWEGFAAVDPKMFSRKSVQKYHLVWIGFDANDRVFGVFPQYSVLPEFPGVTGSAKPAPEIDKGGSGLKPDSDRNPG